jgi:hypothetical protein
LILSFPIGTFCHNKRGILGSPMQLHRDKEMQARYDRNKNKIERKSRSYLGVALNQIESMQQL